MEERPTKLTEDQIKAILERCFGTGAHALGIHEIGGGTFNETYVIEVSEKEKLVLRVAPPRADDTYWDDVALMRREHNTLPYFAAIGAFLPKTLLADFTHQIVGRDYVLQTFLEGERWSDIEDELTEEENLDLWRGCGEIVKRMHGTTGQQFGYPYPGRSFPNWHDVVIDRFSRIAQSLNDHGAGISYFSDIVEVVRSAEPVLNEIREPHLLHGDLWTFNLLVTRKNGRPRITGVLDTERAWWGDPLADWIMFCLSIRSEEEEWPGRISAFYQGYGELDKSTTAQFRQEVYNAMHIGSSVVWSVKHGNRDDIERGTQDLKKIASLLTELLQ